MEHTKFSSHFTFFTVCKTFPFLSIICKHSSFLSAAMTENPGSELQYCVPLIGLTFLLNEADEFTT